VVLLIPCKNWGCDDRHTNYDWYEDTAKRHWDRNDSAAVYFGVLNNPIAMPALPTKAEADNEV